MRDVTLQLALVGVLVLINAAFAGSEIALISLRPSQVDRLRERGGSGKVLAGLADDPNRFLSTIQVGITLGGFLASATAAVSLAEPLVEPLNFLGAAARPVAVVLVTVLLTYVTLVVGELAPKRVAMQRAEGWGLAVARPLHLLAQLTTPVVWLLGRSTDLVVRAAGVDPSEQREEVSDEELREMVLTRSASPRHRTIFEGAFEMADRQVREILVPRRDVVLVPPDASAQEALEILNRAGHSRAPVGEDLDSPVGVVHLRDLVGARDAAAALARPALFLPETVPVLEALRRLQRERQHLAVVVDEYGGGSGIVSLEDVLEELVGEIYDEFDAGSSGADVQSDGSLVVDGAFPIHDLPDLGVTLPEGPYTTVAGLLLDRLGRLPVEGESADVGEWRVEAAEVDERAVTKVRLIRIRGTD